MGSPDRVLLIRDLRGGMNSTDSPTSLPDNQVVDAVDTDLDLSMLGARRRGAAPVNTIWPGTFGGYPAWLYRHVPANDVTAAELWAWDNETTPKLGRLTPGGTALAAVTVSDAATAASLPWASGSSFNGKLYVAYDSAVARMHLWDGTSLRRAGLNPPSAPTLAETAGAATDTRKYRIRLTIKSGATVLLRSEASAVTAAATLSSERVTATSPGSFEAHATHWELEASSILTNYTVWYVVADAAVATTTIEDNNASLLSLTVSGESGLYALPPSAKYVVADRDRVLFLNNWEDTTKASRVEWTPVIGSGVGDGERILSTSSISSYLDLAPGLSGQITGGARFQGSVYVFKDSAIYKLARTGDVEAPYQPVLVSDSIGAVDHRSIVEGEDEFGNPALYFYGQAGPYRLGQRGVEYLGADLKSYWQTANLAGLVGRVHAVWHAYRRQVWYFVALGAYNAGSMKFVFHVDHGRREGASVRGGWTRHTVPVLVSASCLYSSTFTAPGGTTTIPNPITQPYRPWMGYYTGSPYLAIGDYPGYDQDNDGNPKNFTAAITTKPYVLGGSDSLFGVSDVQVLSRSPSASGYESRVKATLIKDWGAQSDATATTTNAYSASLTQVVGDMELTRSGCTAVQVKLEDGGSPTSMSDVLEWNLDSVTIRYRHEDRR